MNDTLIRLDDKRPSMSLRDASRWLFSKQWAWFAQQLIIRQTYELAILVFGKNTAELEQIAKSSPLCFSQRTRSDVYQRIDTLYIVPFSIAGAIMKSSGKPVQGDVEEGEEEEGLTDGDVLLFQVNDDAIYVLRIWGFDDLARRRAPRTTRPSVLTIGGPLSDDGLSS